MGYALAEAALAMGAKVVLVSGPTSLKPPKGAELLSVQTAEEMRTQVLEHLSKATIVIKAAAVADYRPKQMAKHKIKRKNEMTVELEPTADIVAEVAKRRKNQIIVGFAAETENVLENARKKLSAKKLDAIVVNDVSKPGIGFDSDRNAVTIITSDGASQVPEASKKQIAESILRFIVGLKHSRAVQHASK
jgi:phosphopantothenoylcysteine decarboxylase/phosphopantothenate--cysteine ligase